MISEAAPYADYFRLVRKARVKVVARLREIPFAPNELFGYGIVLDHAVILL